MTDNTTAPTEGTLSSPFHPQAPYQQYPYAPTTAMPFQMYSPYVPESNFAVPDLEELSASLGLPGAKKPVNVTESPAHSQASLGSDAIPGIYSKLLSRAQDTPLTADSLARMLKSRSESSEETVKAAHERRDPFAVRGSPADEAGQALKVVRAPPGFGDQTPRMVKVEEEQVPSGPATSQMNVNAGPSSYLMSHGPSIGQSSTPFQQQQHARQPSSRRRPRGHPRPKRTDQGPEPSAADIYPDDANWMPAAPAQVHRGYFAPPPPQVAPPYQPKLPVQVRNSWPTPAEVYMHREPQPPQVAHSPQKPDAQTFNLFEGHVAPSPEDMNAADDEVLTLLDQLPEPRIDTLIQFGAFDLIGDERPLSPLQQDGKRYGVNYYGIGIGDEWKPPAVPKGASWDKPAQFRVRPRDHVGWGGWGWGIKNGWADE